MYDGSHPYYHFVMCFVMYFKGVAEQCVNVMGSGVGFDAVTVNGTTPLTDPSLISPSTTGIAHHSSLSLRSFFAFSFCSFREKSYLITGRCNHVACSTPSLRRSA